MHKLSVQFNNNVYQKLQENSEKKEVSLAQYVRELVEIGLRVEELSVNNNINEYKKTDADLLGDSKTLLKNNLLWSLESLYLVRCLTNDLLPNTSEHYLSMAKQKALTLVEKLLQGEA